MSSVCFLTAIWVYVLLFMLLLFSDVFVIGLALFSFRFLFCLGGFFGRGGGSLFIFVCVVFSYILLLRFALL